MDESTYRTAERALWESVGVVPEERRVRLAGTGTEVRVLEVGEGAPVLFVHGGPNAGSTWATVAARLPGVRSLIVDRPGAGLSEPLAEPLTVATLPGFADRFAADVLDALDVERADLVASSFGGYLALRASAGHPGRFGRMVQLGCPAFVPGMATPSVLRMLASPLRHVIPRLPADDRGTASSMRQLGHGASVAAGRITPAEMAWLAAMRVATETFVHDGRMIANLVSPWRGADPAVTLSPELLASVRQPTRIIWGEADPFGGPAVGEALAAALPDAELHVLAGGGHLPWLDDADRCADLVRTHLAGERSARDDAAMPPAH
jgi:2-hydroxy-6-oxonona-2,4-dienedioate hydrolase